MVLGVASFLREGSYGSGVPGGIGGSFLSEAV